MLKKHDSRQAGFWKELRGRDGGVGIGNGGKYFICLQYSGSQCKEGLMYSAWGREIKRTIEKYKVFVGP